MVAGGEDVEDLAGGEDGGDGVEAAGEGFADDADVGTDVVMLEGEELAGAAEAGLDFVAEQEDVVVVADLAELGEVAGGRDDDAGFALDRLYENGDGVAGDGGADGFGVTEGDLAEAGGKGAEAALVLGFGGEADDGDGAAVEVIGADEDLTLAGGDAAHGLAPFAGGFEGGFDGFDAGVHGQGHVEAGEFVQVAVEEGELVVAEGAGGEGDALGLGDHGGEDAGVAVALVDGGVGGEEIEVAVAFDVGDPGAGGTGDDDVEGVVVVGAVLVFERDEGLAFRLGRLGLGRFGLSGLRFEGCSWHGHLASGCVF